MFLFVLSTMQVQTQESVNNAGTDTRINTIIVFIDFIYKKKIYPAKVVILTIRGKFFNLSHQPLMLQN